MTVTTEARRGAMRLYHHANRERVLAKKREYREARRQELREKQLAYRAANIEAERNRDRERSAAKWRSDPAFRESSNERMRRWRARNPGVLAARQREQYAQDPSRWLEIRNRRRALEQGAPVVERIDRAAIIARDASRCHICGKRVPKKQIQLDHLVPLSKGGEHTARNQAVAHAICNQRRGPGRIPAQLRLIG